MTDDDAGIRAAIAKLQRLAAEQEAREELRTRHGGIYAGTLDAHDGTPAAPAQPDGPAGTGAPAPKMTTDQYHAAYVTAVEDYENPKVGLICSRCFKFQTPELLHVDISGIRWNHCQECTSAAPAEQDNAAVGGAGVTPRGYPFRRVLPTLRPGPAVSTRCTCAERRGAHNERQATDG